MKKKEIAPSWEELSIEKALAFKALDRRETKEFKRRMVRVRELEGILMKKEGK